MLDLYDLKMSGQTKNGKPWAIQFYTKQWDDATQGKYIEKSRKVVFDLFKEEISDDIKIMCVKTDKISLS